MPELIRAILTGKTKVTITHFHQLTEDFSVLVYSDGNGEHAVDIFKIPENLRDVLALVEAGHTIQAELDVGPDGKDPVCLSAEDLGTK